MTTPVRVSRSRAYPVAVEETFDRLLPMPLPALFASRYGPLPRIRAVDPGGPDLAWGTVGQRRTIRLADGGTLREHLTSVQRPHRFDYEITDITGALAALVTHVEGSWTVEPAGTGSRVTWEWTLFPRGRVGALGVPVIARFWPGYARAALARLEDLLLV